MMVDMSVLGSRPTLYAFLVLLGGFLVKYSIQFYKMRGIFRSLQKQGLVGSLCSTYTSDKLTFGSQCFRGALFPAMSLLSAVPCPGCRLTFTAIGFLML